MHKQLTSKPFLVTMVCSLNVYDTCTHSKSGPIYHGNNHPSFCSFLTVHIMQSLTNPILWSSCQTDFLPEVPEFFKGWWLWAEARDERGGNKVRAVLQRPLPRPHPLFLAFLQVDTHTHTYTVRQRQWGLADKIRMWHHPRKRSQTTFLSVFQVLLVFLSHVFSDQICWWLKKELDFLQRRNPVWSMSSGR